jgi:hypothetical protein
MFYRARQVKSNTILVKPENVPQSFSMHLQTSVRLLICRSGCNIQQLRDKDSNFMKPCCSPVVGSNDVVNTLRLQQDGNARNGSPVRSSQVIANLRESIHETSKGRLRTIAAVSDGVGRVLRFGKVGRADLL